MSHERGEVKRARNARAKSKGDARARVFRHTNTSRSPHGLAYIPETVGDCDLEQPRVVWPVGLLLVLRHFLACSRADKERVTRDEASTTDASQ